MITASEERFIARYAHVPEHLTGYVVAVSRKEPHLLGEYVCYFGEDALVVVGYPLRSAFDERTMLEALGSAVSRFTPGQVAAIAPTVPVDRGPRAPRDRDHYYRLDLSRPTLPGKVRNMVRRASRELRVERTPRIDADHLRLVREFLDSHHLGEDARSIYERIPAYVASVPTARVFSARDGAGDLVAFDVADAGAAAYAFYQFNFRSRRLRVPGASDLLLHELVGAARAEGKSFVNLGLGISPGVARFKEKWGGRPFLAYECCRYRPAPRGLLDILPQKR